MRKMIMLLLLLPLFTAQAFADDVYTQTGEDCGTAAIEEAVPDGVRDISGELSVDGSYNTQGALERLWKSFAEKLKSSVKDELKTASALIGISFACAACGALCSDKTSEKMIGTAACAAVVYLTVSGAESVLQTAEGALLELTDYSRAALPVIFTASAASGAALSAPSRYAAVCLALDVMMSAAQKVIIPIICTYLALSISASVFPEPFVKASAQFAKKAGVTIMTVMTIAFSAYIGVTGLVSGSMDAVAVKTAKTVISTSLPVVGGIISDAASTVLSAASVVKNSSGVFSLIVVCAMCVGPFAMLGVKMLLFKLSSAVAETAPNGNLSQLLSDIGDAMGMLTGLVGCCAIMLFISIVSGIKAVTG